jgi:hypothetical protein
VFQKVNLNLNSNKINAPDRYAPGDFNSLTFSAPFIGAVQEKIHKTKASGIGAPNEAFAADRKKPRPLKSTVSVMK